MPMALAAVRTAHETTIINVSLAYILHC